MTSGPVPAADGTQTFLVHAALAREFAAYRAAASARDAPAAWAALERAHVLSQPMLLLHLRVHLMMLGLALRMRDGREVAGQLLRLALAPLGHATGRTPLGNTGRSNVSAFAPMPVPADLADALGLHGARPATTNMSQATADDVRGQP